MRKAFKNPDSKIIKDNLKYISGNSTNNKKISKILLKEQKTFCAYTDEHISRTDSRDIEHFNPTLKNTSEDNYFNWFLVKHQWNKEKSYKWEKFQPVLQPTAEDFEERVIYFEGDYIAKASDEEAKNVIKLLQLDDAGLADKRKRYIKRKHKEINETAVDKSTYFFNLIHEDICQISYIRAIKEEFGIDIWEIL